MIPNTNIAFCGLTVCFSFSPPDLIECSSEPAGVCEVLTAAGGTEKEDQFVPPHHCKAVYHYFSPVLQTVAPAWTHIGRPTVSH